MNFLHFVLYMAGRFWYNGSMKDNDNMVQCDCCLGMFPASHMAGTWGWSDICVPCDLQIAKDLGDLDAAKDLADLS